MSLNHKITGLIGFAAKSGRLLQGTFSVEQGIRQKNAKLILAAADTNPKRREILRLWCLDMEIPFLCMGTKEEYGALLRKPPLGLLAVTDGHMVSGIMEAAKIDGGD